MATRSFEGLEPRKQPRQARSQVTVEAIFDAAIQVLLSDGSTRVTTTRVADRAGVSVGTLYQYFPNRRALLYGALERHLVRVGDAVETAAKSVHHASLSAMVAAIVEAFVRAKTERVEEVRAFYDVATELDAVESIARLQEHNCAAISNMLASAPAFCFDDVTLTSRMVCLAMSGPTRDIFRRGASAQMLGMLRTQLESLCLGYLERQALPR